MPISQDKSAPRIILVTLAVTLFVTLMVIVIVQTAFPKPKIRTYADGYREGFIQARSLILSTPAGVMMSQAKELLSGTVKSINASSLTFTAVGLIIDPKIDGVGFERTINVSTDTNIKLRTSKTGEELAKEMNEYQAAVKANPSANLKPPIPYNENSIKLSDIKPNDRLSVWGEKNQDLTTIDPINASLIVITK
jgi:hypothetical protein